MAHILGTAQDSGLRTQDSRLKTQDSRLKTQDSPEQFPYTEPTRRPVHLTHREAIFDLACELAGGLCPETHHIHLARLKVALVASIATRKALDPLLSATAIPAPLAPSFEADAWAKALAVASLALAEVFADSASLILAAAEVELARRVRSLESGGALIEL